MDRNYKKVGVFVPCCIDQFAADTGLKLCRLLERMGVDYMYPEELTCCGRELYYQGDRDGAKLLGKQLMSLYEGCSFVVGCGSGCMAYVQRCFKSLFHNTTYHNSYRNFADRCVDVCDFLVNVAEYRPATEPFRHRVALLDHCMTSRDYRSPAHPERAGLHDEMRTLIGAIEGVEIVELAEEDVCCGAAGLFASQFTPISDALAKRKLDNAIEAGAEYIVSTEMECLLHLRSYAEKSKMEIKFLHIIDLL